MVRPHRMASAVLGVLLVIGLAPSASAVASIPAAITVLTGSPGPERGQIVFRWQSTGVNTDHFVLETAITSFHMTNREWPRQGRGAKSYLISRTARSFTLSATQVAAAGAGLGTGNHLYFQLAAINSELRQPPVTQAYARVQAVMPLGRSAKKRGTKVRAGTFNVRTARATTDKRRWLVRAPDVAREIVSNKLDVVALQELSPGRADGKKTSTNGTPRQTTSLLSSLAKVGGTKYRLVRTTPYVKPGTAQGSQGARILYDSSRFELLSRCPEKAGSKSYNSSCTIVMPILSSDSRGKQRRAAYAELKDKRTKRKFFVISAHLDQRHSTKVSEEVRYNQLRGAQATAIVKALKKINPKNRRVIFGGDINSWQTNKIGHAPHTVLVRNGFFDSASARRTINISYGTSNQFKTVLAPNIYKFGTRIDAVMVKGTKGANLFANVMKKSNSARPSDHNLVLADLVL